MDNLGVETARTEAVEGSNVLWYVGKGAWNVDRSAGARWAGKDFVVVVVNNNWDVAIADCRAGNNVTDLTT